MPSPLSRFALSRFALSRFALVAVLLSASAAYAVPNEQQTEDEDRGGTITLTILDQAIIGDARSFCSLHVVLVNGHADLTAGDTIGLEVTEDDLIGNDTLWEMDIAVTPAEAAAQRLDRTFDCSGDFGEDVNADLDIFARASVSRDDCGTFCNDADPSTATLTVHSVQDDGNEEDDGSAMAHDLPLGRVNDRIGRDQDWQRISLLDPSVVTLDVLHRPAVGRLDLTLFDGAGNSVGEGVAQAGQTHLEAGPLVAGEYRVRIQPRDGADYNFYDLELRVAAGGCNPGVMESEPCGNCGTRQRLCAADARWGDFGACAGEGPCAAGAIRASGCARCGTQMQTCDMLCMWSDGACENQGVCEPEEIQTEVCEANGERSRACNDACQWGDFAECVVDGECADGETRDCYDGPAGTEDVGACRGGRQRCQAGAWGNCLGQTQPSVEVCTDGLDNDCDGAADDTDDACPAGGAAVGDACSDDQDCGADGLVCLNSPSTPQFRGGYCSLRPCDVSCPEDAVCGTAFGQRVCLKVCGADADCRVSYRCADVEADATACIPQCQRDVDCADAREPVCDRGTGLCVGAGADQDMGVAPPVRDAFIPPPRVDAFVPPNGGPDVGVAPAADMGGTSGRSSGDDGCAACDVGGRHRQGGWMLMALLGLGIVRRRRG